MCLAPSRLWADEPSAPPVVRRLPEVQRAADLSPKAVLAAAASATAVSAAAQPPSLLAPIGGDLGDDREGADLLQGPGLAADETEPLLPTTRAGAGDPWGPKAGFLQRVQFQESYLPDLGTADGLGLHTIQAALSVGIPVFSFRSPLVLTTGLQTHLTQGPLVTDVSPRLYEATLDALWIRPLTSRLTAHLAVTPGAYSDFQSDDGRAFRLTGRGFGIYQASPTTKWILGIVYLNRPGLRIVPAVGLNWRPSDDWRVDLVFPQPRLARRMVANSRYERWMYAGCELGGGVWAVERADGQADVLSISDWRWKLGFEHLPYRGWKSWYELAYVSFRTLRYQDQPGHFSLDDTLMLRAGTAW